MVACTDSGKCCDESDPDPVTQMCVRLPSAKQNVQRVHREPVDPKVPISHFIVPSAYDVRV